MKLYNSKSFNTKKGKYVYDSIMNSLHEVNGEFYYIINLEEIKLENRDYYNNYIKEYGIRNILIPAEIEISHRFNLENIKNVINSNRDFLVLSITNKCNLNCTYCIYHDKFSDSSNMNHTMSFETATKAIDQMMKKSLNLDKIHIGFYGGESLLEFELIKKCVEYVNRKSIGVIANFGLTTNALLLENEEIRRYFERYNFQVNISLDGPKSINDRYRVTKTGNGSYDKIIKNMKLWYTENPKYFIEKITITTVEAPPLHIKALDDFFMCFPVYYSASSINSTSFFEANIANYKNEYTNKVLNRNNVIYSDNYKQELIKSYKNYIPKSAPPLTSTIIPGGTCVPIFTRWYVNSKGDYYPCERVPESDEFCIGNVDTDVDLEKVVGLFDKYINTAKSKCEDCWAIRLCGRCFKNINEDCEQLLETIERRYIYYIENIKDNKEAMAIIESINYSM